MNKMADSLNTPKIRFDGFVKKWSTKVVGDILKIKSGISQKGIESPNGIYPILATGGEIGRTNIALYSRESVLIGRKGTIDKPYYMNSPFWTVDTLFYSELFRDVDGRFVYTLFQRIPWRKFDTSTGVPSLTSTAIHSISITIPQIKEQKAIGELFQTLDQTLTLKRQKHEKTKILKKALLTKLFPQAGQSQPKMRLNGFSGDWVEIEMKDTGHLTAGGDIDKVQLSNKGEYPVLANALTKEGILGYYNDYSIEAPAITITGRGDVGFAKARYYNFTAVVRLLVLKNHSNFDPLFLESAINRKCIYIESTGVPQLTVPQFAKLKIKVPPEREQIAIGKLFKKLDDTLALQAKQIKTLENLKKALLAKMFV